MPATKFCGFLAAFVLAGAPDASRVVHASVKMPMHKPEAIDQPDTTLRAKAVKTPSISVLRRL